MGKRVAILVGLGEEWTQDDAGWYRNWIGLDLSNDRAARASDGRWMAWGPGSKSRDRGDGQEPTPEAARAAADAWLESYIARVNEETREHLNALAAGMLPDDEAAR